MGLDDFEDNRNRYQEAVKNLPHLAGMGSLVYTMESNRVSMSLNAFEALTDLFKDSILYGLKRPDNENEQVFPLPSTPYSDASDLAEKSGCILMQKIHTEWIEA